MNIYDLSICMLFFLFPVGLDIQRKFTVFYSGPKRFGNQIIIQKKSETEISHSEHSDRSTVAGPKKGKHLCLFLFCIKASIRLVMVSSV